MTDSITVAMPVIDEEVFISFIFGLGDSAVVPRAHRSCRQRIIERLEKAADR